jgi:orotidine-5'-phosphate decarboxylase
MTDMIMKFQDKLDATVSKNNSLVCVGLDPDLKKIPEHVRSEKHPLFEFNKAIIDTTHDLVCIYKPNSAFYEAEGAEGIVQLKKTCDYIRETYPDIPILLDFKRGDIGNTNQKYCDFAFGYLQVDAVTVQPYAGRESLAPFFEYTDRGIFVLCKTSNSGSDELQNLSVDGVPLYRHIATAVIQTWNEHGNCMLVVGATYPQQLEELRNEMGDMVFLVPGVGKQGGTVERILKGGLNSKKRGLIINSSRGILYAGSGKDFAEAARIETVKMREEINKFR